jgi:hypothetical protein
MVIALADRHYRWPAVRVTHARELVGCGEARFWARMPWLIDQPEVEATYPTFVRRQRRLRDHRRRQRRLG